MNLRQLASLRLLDRLVWTPALALLALRRRRSPPPAPERIGMMMFETIGDTLLASGLLRGLQALPGDPELRLFVSAGNREAAALIADPRQLVEVPLTDPVAAIRTIRAHPVDVMVDIGQWPRWYAFLCAVSRSRFTVGFATPGQQRGMAYDAAVVHRSDRHELDNFAALAAPLSAGPVPAPALRPLPRPEASLAGLADAPFVVFHPAAGGFRGDEREWPAAHWAALGDALAGRGLRVLLSGASDDAGKLRAILDAARHPERFHPLAGRCRLADLGWLLSQAAAVVAVNTGVMHLAALVEAPLVALHGPTRRDRWGPTGRRSVALAASPGPDAEFLDLGFEYPARRIRSMARITVDEVLAATLAQIDGEGSRR